MKEFGKTDSNCESQNGIYHFYLYGDYDSGFNTNDKIILKLDYPNTTLECTPLSKENYSKDSIKCLIDICEFPLEKNVLISSEEPQSNNFEFPNWSSFMNENPGISNKVNDTHSICYPEEKTTFQPSDIISYGCEGGKNKFKIIGEWMNVNKVTFKELLFKLPLVGQNGKMADCEFQSLNEIICLFDGYGEIKFENSFFKAILSPYKIEKSPKVINVTQCFNNGNYFKMKIILVIFIICLIFI